MKKIIAYQHLYVYTYLHESKRKHSME